MPIITCPKCRADVQVIYVGRQNKFSPPTKACEVWREYLAARGSASKGEFCCTHLDDAIQDARAPTL
jgi:hypothetical protein